MRPALALDLVAALSDIAAGADALDLSPAFPHEAFAALAACGALAATLPDEHGRRIDFAQELSLVSDVSRADGSVGRILDGHFNAVERLTVARPDTLSDEERSALAAGRLLLGVWGADPAPGEGQAARLIAGATGIAVHGVKTFCSGAGGLQRALVIVRDEAGERCLAYVDLRSGVSVDRSWYRGAGLRASESHRVVFDGAPVLALLGGADELTREPWFSRDAIRTSATWAGIAASVVDAALSFLAQRGGGGDLVALAAGRMRAALGTIARWQQHAGDCARHGAPLTALAIESRWAIAQACREISDQAAQACGARPLAIGGALSRGRRDLDLFLLQHRLEPLLARHGAAAIDAASQA